MKFINDENRTAQLIFDTCVWLKESGKNPSKWWNPDFVNMDLLLKYGNKKEFFIGISNNMPAVAAILHISDNNKDWQKINKGKSPKALYIHWLCVNRKFAGQGLPKKLIDFAKEYALKNNVHYIRVDTNAEEEKLKTIYEKLGFQNIGTINEGYRDTVFYQIKI